MSARIFKRRNGSVWYAWAYDSNGKRRQVSTRCTDSQAASAFADRLERELQGVKDDETIRTSSAPRSFVYFVQLGTAGPIKIGRAAPPSFRVARLQTAAHERLHLRGTIAGGAMVERALHAFFKAERLTGEWFRPSKRLLRLIAELPA